VLYISMRAWVGQRLEGRRRAALHRTDGRLSSTADCTLPTSIASSVSATIAAFILAAGGTQVEAYSPVVGDCCYF